MLVYVSCLEPEDFKTASILMDDDGCMDALALHAKVQLMSHCSAVLSPIAKTPERYKSPHQ